MTETTVTVTTNNENAAPNKQPGALSWIRFNYDYFKSIPGVLKIIQAILGILCMVFASPAMLAGTHWFLFVVVTSFIATLIWISIYFLSIREALTLPINWILTEMLNTCIMTILYLTGFIIQLYTWSPNYHPQIRDPNIIAGVIGILNTMAYAAGSYFLYVEWKASTPPQ
ncbi:plasmolipin-like [Lycorma delicatula]|uniref:plasmolipin-like n=1 Tax=Lycorma delicatula TaxID=130591 RepID=UPI003F51914E